MTYPSDRTLVQDLTARIESALDVTYQKYRSLMFRIANNFLSSPEDSDECVNDALMDIWNSIPPQSPDNLGTYAAVLTRRRAISRIRYNTAAKRNAAQNVTVTALEELSEVLPDADRADDYDNTLIRNVLNRFLSGLPTKDRDLFVTRYFSGADYRYLCELFGKSENTLRQRLYRMRQKLRAELEKEGVFLS